MNPTAQAALSKARQSVSVFSTETAVRRQPVPVLVVHGPINEYMLRAAREEAVATVRSLRNTLNGPDGIAKIVDALKRTAAGRPGSHVAGYLDVIQMLEAGAQ